MFHFAYQVQAQTLIPIDMRDPIGQRLGWSPEKIVQSLSESPYYKYIGYVTLGAKPGNILIYQGGNGEKLIYEMQNDRAVEAFLIFLKKSDGWAEETIKIHARFPVIYSSEESTKYKGIYCNILIYETTDNRNGEEEVSFRYFQAE